MTIRVNKTRDFSIIANHPLNDASLDWECRGLLAYLLSKPDGWQIQTHQLIKAGTAGKDKVLRILKDLETAGYIKRIKARDLKTGHFVYVSEVYEIPDLKRNSADDHPLEGIATADESREGCSTAGESREGFSTAGKTSYGKASHIVNTERTITESINTEELNTHTDPERAREGRSHSPENFKQPTAAEQKSQLTATHQQTIPVKNPTQEISAIPPLICAENPQQAPLPPVPDVIPIEQKTSGSLAILDAPSDPLAERMAVRGSYNTRKPMHLKAIEIYNQMRPQGWAEQTIEFVSAGLLRSLDAVYLMFSGDSPEETERKYLKAIGYATVAIGSSEFHNQKTFGSKNLPWLVATVDRLFVWANKYSQLPLEKQFASAQKAFETEKVERVFTRVKDGSVTTHKFSIGDYRLLKQQWKAGNKPSDQELRWMANEWPELFTQLAEEMEYYHAA